MKEEAGIRAAEVIALKAAGVSSIHVGGSILQSVPGNDTSILPTTYSKTAKL